LVVKGNIGMRDGEILRTTDSVYQLSTLVPQTPGVMGKWRDQPLDRLFHR
jgi:hypothetical protein